MQQLRRACVAGLLGTLVACYSGGDPLEGWIDTQRGDGPRIVFDLFAKPLPEIPFPNDLATRPAPDAPTGRKVNASLDAPTFFERDLRQKLSRVDGFGTSAPIWLRFESPDPARPELARLDLERIVARQKSDGAVTDDVVLIINVTPGSKTYGEAMPLDFGSGAFPMTIEDPDEYFDADPRSLASNMSLETYDEDKDGDGHFDEWEDVNQNGALDPGEDKDGDGKLDDFEDSDADGTFDVPNLWSTATGDTTRNDPYRDLVQFYELESDTLFFRPMAPLDEATTYAVVLMKDLVGINGEPVQSPFPFGHHLQQTAPLAPLFDDGLLERYGRTKEDVAFAWTFTTQSVTRDMVALREGLYGIGPFDWLADAYKPDMTAVPVREARDGHVYTMPAEKLGDVVRLIFERFPVGDFDSTRVEELLETYESVDYFVAGDYTSPDFLAAGPNSWDIDTSAGTGSHQPGSLRYLLVVPKRSPTQQGPFPVVMYAHGYTSLKLEAVAFAGVLARFGMATFVIDAYSHGFPIGPEFDSLIQGILTDFDAAGLIPFYNAIKRDRARDLNNDSLVEPAGDFWTNDTFHTRDIVRQTLLDYMQATRILRSFDGRSTWATDINGDGVANDIAGDFNGDGTVDVGGWDTPYYAMGTSMGGILSSMLVMMDPAIVAGAPISPGGGLFEIGLRTGLSPVQKAVFLPIFGPMIIAEPLAGDPRITKLSWLTHDVFELVKLPFAKVGEFVDGKIENELRPGDRVRVQNLRTLESREVRVDRSKQFRLHIPADRLDPIEVTVLRPDGTLVKHATQWEFEVESFQGFNFPYESPLVAPQQGMGYQRNTPSLRRLLGIAQTILEPADPVNYAARYGRPFAVRPDPIVPKNVLITAAMGDETVPIATAVALARAAGVVDFRDIDPRYGMTQNDLLVRTHVVEAIDKLRYFNDDPCHYDPRATNFDIDDLSNGMHPEDIPRLGKITRPPACAGANPPATCSTECPILPPLRATRTTEHGSSGLRIVALEPGGRHAIDLPNPNLPFDPSTFSLNQIGLFLSTGGKVLTDHPCLATDNCEACSGDAQCPVFPPRPTVSVVP